jgi:hypothetical protein
MAQEGAGCRLRQLYVNPDARSRRTDPALRSAKNRVLFVHDLDADPRKVSCSVGPHGDNTEYGKLLIDFLAENHSRVGETASPKGRRIGAESSPYKV